MVSSVYHEPLGGKTGYVIKIRYEPVVRLS